MFPFRRGIPHCKRCGVELEGGEQTCPHCRFNPRQKGLRIALGLFMVVVVAMTLLTLSIPLGTGLAPYLFTIAVFAFALSIVTFFLSFLITPYRFGSIFTWMQSA